MTATPSVPGTKPPRLLTTSRNALVQEATVLKRHIETYAQAPQPGCRFLVEGDAWKDASHHSQRAHRRRLQLQGMQLSRLTFANVHDHMWSTSRLLDGDNSIPLYSHHTLARVACEAAARIGYLLDSTIDYDGRLLRSAVLALTNVDARIAAARDVAAARPMLSHTVDGSMRDRDILIDQIQRAGISLRRNDRERITHLEIGTPTNVEPLMINLTELMKKAYPERTAVYRYTSGVVHSNPWVLNDIVTSSPLTSALALSPDIPDIGATALALIDASIIVTESYATYYGHDPAPAVRRSKSRAQVIGVLLGEWFTKPLSR